MNSLPRWFGRKKSREDKLRAPIEISEPFAPVHREGLSSLSSLGHSLASLTEQENENLYVNGAVPAGQFKEYFMPPSDLNDHKFLAPFPPSDKPVSLSGSVRNLLPQVSRKIVKRTESIRSALSVKTSPRLTGLIRQDSGRSSELRKSFSVDNVLEDSSEEINNYYNLTYLTKEQRAASNLILNEKNLARHQNISSSPLSLSYLGHTTATLLSASGMDLDSDQDTDRDSGALSMGGGWG